MDHWIPFVGALLIFILVWVSLLQLPYIEKVSTNKAVAYSTISMFVSIIVFISLGMMYRIDHLQTDREEMKERFYYDYMQIFSD